jgi:glycogen debranching enzyme
MKAPEQPHTSSELPVPVEPARPRKPPHSPYYIHPKAAHPDDSVLVLKHNDTFAVFDRFGDIQPVGMGEQGIYHQGTRFLSKFILHLGRKRPLLLSSTVREDNVLLAVDLANPDVYSKGQVLLPRCTVHLYRTKFLWNGVCYERLRIANYGQTRVDVGFSLRFDNDFFDVFEVRGQRRERRGTMDDPRIETDGIVLGYLGLDGIKRYTRIRASPSPFHISTSELSYKASLAAQSELEYFFTTSCHIGSCHIGDSEPETVPYETALGHAGRLRSSHSGEGSIYTSNEQFNDWLNRSAADLHTMTTAMPAGPYPYAGVPWFSTPFGRDALIAAFEYLWLDASLARGVLAYLASTQATSLSPEQDAEPGKILHEARSGEMAALKEVPFGRYYGSVDSTPLFVLLCASYFRRTADLDFLGSIWGNIEAALSWIDRYGDPDQDGFVEYYRKTPKGLAQQGWKDSQDSVSHANGALAEGPIALCEVQGYVYAAKLGIADVAAALGQARKAEELTRQARELQERFERAFWSEQLSTYALALDGEKRPCLVRASNAGHCLFSGIASPEHAVRTANTLLGESSFSGWGIRTLAAHEVRYNPMSYHNGSVWPHDNALIAFGMSQYELKPETAKIMTGVFDASIFVNLHRMPELFCGFDRRAGKGPTLYPVACSPQSWSAGAVFLFLQACLGLSIDARVPRLTFSHPFLPPSLRQVGIRNLMVGSACVDVSVERHAEIVGIDILRREPHVDIVTIN